MNWTKELSTAARRKVRTSFVGDFLSVVVFLLFDVFLLAGGHFVVMTDLFLLWITYCLNVLSTNDPWNRSNRSRKLLYKSSFRETRVANSKTQKERTFYFLGNFCVFGEKIESRKEVVPILTTSM
jgi:hypothetical protein